MQLSAERQAEKSRKLLIFAERLKSRRHRLNLSQIELAEKADVSPRSVVAWESGNDNLPRGLELGRLIKALDVDMMWLFGDDSPKDQINDTEMEKPVNPLSPHTWTETATLEKILTEMVTQLSKAPAHERKYILGNINGIVNELEERELNSSTDAAVGRLLKKASASVQNPGPK